MHYPKPYIEYLLHFHGSRDWFECHEIMEELWKAEPSAERKQWWLALVQIAVGLYHERRGNMAGAIKMLSSALSHARPVPWCDLGLDGERLLSQLQIKLTEVNSALAAGRRMQASPDYEEWNLPIADPELRERCKELCEQRGWMWCLTNSHVMDEVVHRHKLRDRQDVIAAREEAHRLKQRERGAESS
ncbi:DUF309 domain-containing protein [Paenibacillus apiarius]|uniref:DUF309 domain-containing protein n=1 Tax=Paenibacillus apiarius TaxID=46240 RepID=A0ABT4DTU3_9BACL|nr:DUF309 domain-containing protein [Paenibacillus apiarius]MCY9515866.1 DUF309 domain-containing protein [Paenibacillus apiarius]MCY9520776.1 DUF309 domain-containing protein [Paenibacillus apiarius]MCY9553480.1 DUF309 domain-containing protein [Paenibacillus apiarius]MCY9557996.1 DUF309 domain-containing protein [Paenibacillus apiarius]MCY9685851.1 DUF309 domain-containing protein [Paenibacillus apiarius]